MILISVYELDDEGATFLNENGIGIEVESNEGFDFGLWYKAFQKVDVNQYDRVFLVNDSCVLFRELSSFMDWLSKDQADIKGMTFSEAVTPHIQSFFMVLNKKAIKLTVEYFIKNGIKRDINEVIRTYELGMSKYFTDNGLKLSAFVDNNGYQGEFSPYYKCVDHHLAKGIPLIKKKILMASYRKDELPNIARMGFNIDPNHYYSLMKQQSDLILDMDKLKLQCSVQMSSIQILIFNIKKTFIKILRPLYRSCK